MLNVNAAAAAVAATAAPSLDLNWWIQLILTAAIVAVALRHLLKTAASKIMIQQEPEDPTAAIGRQHASAAASSACAVCGRASTKQCSACKLVKYCSADCQSSHWNSGHKRECKGFQLLGKSNSKQSAFVQNGRKGSKALALVPDSILSNSIKVPKEVLFSYEDFLELYNWDKAGFPPCGLLNCGNSCFANVILQCLSSTKPLVAYLLEKNHRKECRRNDWCFLCELQTHIERASTSRQPFSPSNILLRLRYIGGNLGYGKQEDAHEFMRFAIDTMQSVCLDEFGGEKVLHPSTQETTLIQHIFGGHLQSQVICSKCCNVSSQCENMMELNVEIHGDATTLEECLNQFTAKEQLHGDNMYKCDGCNDYVMAWKHLMVRRAPNILTIALKRFQSGRFGKLNKKVTFPETLDLSPYMIEGSYGNDVYKLYAVVVHVDMLNASFFGHYICYTKDFHGNWYWIDDCKVSKVDLEEVLSEGAYMLLYSRISPRPSCLKMIGSSSGKEQQTVKVVQGEQSVEEKRLVECLSRAESSQSISTSGSTNSEPKDSVQMDLFSSTSVSDDAEMADSISSQSSQQDMGVFNCQDLKPEIGIASSEVMTDIQSPHSEAGTCGHGLMHSSTENPKCSEDNNIVISGKNHYDSKKEVDKVETENGFLSSNRGKIASRKLVDGTKTKPLFTPGFLGKRPSNNSMKRRGKCPSSAGEFVHQAESSVFHENIGSTEDMQKPHPD